LSRGFDNKGVGTIQLAELIVTQPSLVVGRERE
jgi:hypothetical protein